MNDPVSELRRLSLPKGEGRVRVVSFGPLGAKPLTSFLSPLQGERRIRLTYRYER